jgi:hypothetical protein
VARTRSPEQIEQFSRLLASGVRAVDAYERCGWKRDTANSARLAKDPAVRRRVAEIQRETAVEMVASGANDAPGAELLRLAAQKAIVTGNLTALVQAGRELGAADGSLNQLQVPDEKMSIGQMLRVAKEIDPSGLLWITVAWLLMLIDHNTGRPMPAWTDAAGRPIPPYLDSNLELVE